MSRGMPFFVFAVTASFGLVLLSVPGWAEDECSLYAKTDQRRGAAVISGAAYAVPELHLRFTDANSKPIHPKTVHVHYYWQWLEFPYPEHSWGAWSDAEEWVTCTLKDGNGLLVPARTIEPRGWYKGTYTHFPWNRRPRFDRLEIVIELDDYAPRIKIPKGDLDRYRNKTAVVKLSNGLAEVGFAQSVLPGK